MGSHYSVPSSPAPSLFTALTKKVRPGRKCVSQEETELQKLPATGWFPKRKAHGHTPPSRDLAQTRFAANIPVTRSTAGMEYSLARSYGPKQVSYIILVQRIEPF